MRSFAFKELGNKMFFTLKDFENRILTRMTTIPESTLRTSIFHSIIRLTEGSNI